jgi:cyclophilin family peptidyl-prolyl cis-trans isomerase
MAPSTTENFAMIALGHTPDGVSYKGTKFHRIIENFMIQVGSCTSRDRIEIQGARASGHRPAQCCAESPNSAVP